MGESILAETSRRLYAGGADGGDKPRCSFSQGSEAGHEGEDEEAREVLGGGPGQARPSPPTIRETIRVPWWKCPGSLGPEPQSGHLHCPWCMSPRGPFGFGSAGLLLLLTKQGFGIQRGKWGGAFLAPALCPVRPLLPKRKGRCNSNFPNPFSAAPSRFSPRCRSVRLSG